MKKMVFGLHNLFNVNKLLYEHFYLNKDQYVVVSLKSIQLIYNTFSKFKHMI